MTTALETLAANLPNLSARDQEFATSLLNQAARRGLSEKQLPWVEKLAARATGQEKREEVQVADDMSGVIRLFETAATKRKHPAILLMVEEVGTIRLTVAGPNSRSPGTINVTDRGAWEDRRWFGRLTREGAFEPSGKHRAEATAIGRALEALAADPAKVAAEFGRITGACCFCARELTDKRSVELGYGPVCAKNFGVAY